MTSPPVKSTPLAGAVRTGSRCCHLKVIGRTTGAASGQMCERVCPLGGNCVLRRSSEWLSVWWILDVKSPPLVGCSGVVRMGGRCCWLKVIVCTADAVKGLMCEGMLNV